MGQTKRDLDFPLGTVRLDGGSVELSGEIVLGDSTADIGVVEVSAVAPPSTIVHGQQAVAAAGTAEALGSTTALTQGVTVRALDDNAGLVFIGGSSVDSSNGYPLAAGESIFVAAEDLADVFVDAANNDDAVAYIGG